MKNLDKPKISNLDTDIVNEKDVKYLMESNGKFSIIYEKYGPPPTGQDLRALSHYQR